MPVRRIITWHTPVAILLTVVGILGHTPSYWSSVVCISYRTPNYWRVVARSYFYGYRLCHLAYHHTRTATLWLLYRLTVVIRTWGVYPGGCRFIILIMNAFTPIINKFVAPKHFGEKVKEKKTKKLPHKASLQSL